MTLYIFLAAWTFAAALVGLAVGRFIHTGNPTDEAEDCAAVQDRAWQARRAEWTRRQIDKIESERMQSEAAGRWKREVDDGEGQPTCKLWTPNATVSNGGSFGPPPDWQGTLAMVKKIMLECKDTSLERFSLGPCPIVMRDSLHPGEYRNPFHFLNEFDQWFEFNRRARFEKESTWSILSDMLRDDLERAARYEVKERFDTVRFDPVPIIFDPRAIFIKGDFS